MTMQRVRLWYLNCYASTWHLCWMTDDIALGLEHAFWAGRFEKVVDEPRIVLDGAHNPEGAESLAKSIIDVYPHNKLNLMMGMLANKHHEAYLQHILPLVDTLILTEPDFRRKMDAAELLQIVERVRPAMCRSESGNHRRARLGKGT